MVKNAARRETESRAKCVIIWYIFQAPTCAHRCSALCMYICIYNNMSMYLVCTLAVAFIIKVCNEGDLSNKKCVLVILRLREERSLVPSFHAFVIATNRHMCKISLTETN